jgi:GntR family transcriptional regulator/MocR family aminotransferase
VILIALRRRDPTPLHQQIYARVVELIEDGTLGRGARLPASRRLAQELGVNRSTVYRAYEELWAAGYLESRPGSYTTVRGRGVPSRPAGRRAQRAFDWGRRSTPAARRAHADLLRLGPRAAPECDPGIINFARLTADRDLYPVADLRRAMRETLLRQGKEVLDYGDPAGYPPLRATIARRLRTHGVTVTENEILLTQGAQHGLDLVLRLLAQPGDPVVVESPTYAHALPLFRLHGVTLRPVPMRADGMDLDALARVLRRRRPALVYTVPNFHNPTGITTSQEHRERLLGLTEKHGVPLLEDGFEEEMKYFGCAVLPVKSMDERGLVVYVGTFSKVIFPGLRVGWIAASRDCVERLLAINRFANLSGTNLVHAALDRFCKAGDYESHVRRLHTAYRRRMQVMLRGLEAHLPATGAEWTRPAGGYTLWVRLPKRRLDDAALMAHLRAHGLVVSPGAPYFCTPPRESCFRLSVANLTEAEIATGCERLGRALAALPRR